MNLEANFPAECLEDLFRHLFEKDLFTCTLVCPSWNDFIGTTLSCMEKVNVRCSGSNGLEKVKRLFKNSKRKYVCLEVLTSLTLEEMRELLSLNGRTWTTISTETHFETVSDFLEFLQSIQSSVRKLELTYGQIRTENEPEYKSFDLQFP